MKKSQTTQTSRANKGAWGIKNVKTCQYYSSAIILKINTTAWSDNNSDSAGDVFYLWEMGWGTRSLVPNIG